MKASPARAQASRPPRTLDLVRSTGRPSDGPRSNRVFVNRNLRLDRIGLVGFDMDYTLALYNQPRIEDLSIRATLHKLVEGKGYPEAILGLSYDGALGIRGLVVDRKHGNLFKPDRFGYPGKARHGTRSLSRPAIAELYQRERLRLSAERYAWIDSLFALPEAVLYAHLVDFFDTVPSPRPSYAQLWLDIRECIDLAHRDGLIKDIVRSDLAGYVVRDPGLAEALHKLRSAGKRLFLLTNSAWDYTAPVMSHLLDGVMPAYPSWRHFFDIVVVSAGKPEFFTREHPFVELDGEGLPLVRPSEGPFQRGHIYAGGHIRDFQERARAGGDEVLFVGDHIYGDMIRSKRSSTWRTAMVLQELEHEVTEQDRLASSLARLGELDTDIARLDAELNEQQGLARQLDKIDGGEELEEAGRAELAAARHGAREAVERVRRELRTRSQEHRALEADIDRAFNPYWGRLFTEGYEVSKFGEQVEAYACLYTSRVSNLRFYSPMQYFRGPRARMPHET